MVVHSTNDSWQKSLGNNVAVDAAGLRNPMLLLLLLLWMHQNAVTDQRRVISVIMITVFNELIIGCSSIVAIDNVAISEIRQILRMRRYHFVASVSVVGVVGVVGVDVVFVHDCTVCCS